MTIIENKIQGIDLSRQKVERSTESIKLYLFKSIKYKIQENTMEWTASVVATSRDEAYQFLRSKTQGNIEIQEAGDCIEIHGLSDNIIMYLVNKYQNAVSQALERDKKMKEEILETVVKPSNVKKEENKRAWRLF